MLVRLSLAFLEQPTTTATRIAETGNRMSGLTTRDQARGTKWREPRSGTESAIPRCLQRFVRPRLVHISKISDRENSGNPKCSARARPVQIAESERRQKSPTETHPQKFRIAKISLRVSNPKIISSKLPWSNEKGQPCRANGVDRESGPATPIRHWLHRPCWTIVSPS